MAGAARARLDREGLARMVATGLAALLLLTSGASLSPGAAEARGMRHQAAAIAHRQAAAEDAMRRADRQIRRLEHRHRGQARRFERTSRQLDRSLERRASARYRAARIRERLVDARVLRDRILRVRPDPGGRQVVDRPALRKRVDRLARRLDHQARTVSRVERRAERARRAKHRQARQAPRGRLEARRTARERAESRLGSQIVLMLAVAKDRAGHRVRRSEPRGFRRPAAGRVSQGYGCQRVGKRKANRARCTRFHDGIDIATARGAPVRAAASGYVAYVGWNPWDRGRRAFVVIIGHARGFETIYAHLRPVRRVRAGQHVRRGQAIGVVGLTGRTSGAHVHWEVSRGFRTMDPRRAGR